MYNWPTECRQMQEKMISIDEITEIISIEAALTKMSNQSQEDQRSQIVSKIYIFRSVRVKMQLQFKRLPYYIAAFNSTAKICEFWCKPCDALLIHKTIFGHRHHPS